MDIISMTQKEVDRYAIIKKVSKGELNGTEASNLLNLTTRHMRRLKKKVDKGGAKALAHALRGTTGNRSMPEKEKKKIIKLLHKHYPDFGPTFATEKLDEQHNIIHDPKTIRTIMIKEGLWKPKIGKKKKEHRAWRQRKDHYGEMQQFDGSYHDWFEDRLSCKQCLLLSVDDATGAITHAKFDEHEGVFPVFSFWREYLEEHGKPRSIYLDKFSTYSMNHKLAKENPDTLTQFQRALRALRIVPITAHSPEAKGRVERIFGTLQDRLVKEMRLQKINTIEQANTFLKEIFIPKFNKQFGVVAQGKANLHTKLTQKEHNQLNGIFSRHTTRTVNNDFTLSLNTKWYQLIKEQSITIQKKDKVTMEESPDGTLTVRLRGKPLNYTLLPARPKKTKHTPWVLAASTPNNATPHKPTKKHPWRARFPLTKQKTLINTNSK
jgi:hypothetical protein